MPRFILTSAVAGAPPGGQYTSYAAGVTIADTAENAEPGDIVWPAVCNAASPSSLMPLDAAASAQMRIPAITPGEVARYATGGVGVNVGAQK